jgi:hypothetical protein
VKAGEHLIGFADFIGSRDPNAGTFCCSIHAPFLSRLIVPRFGQGDDVVCRPLQDYEEIHWRATVRPLRRL